MKAIAWAVLLIEMFAGTSCAIKVYLVDRQTVLEDEAAAEWPEFEKEILGKAAASTPTPFPTTADSRRKERLFNVLNSELSSRPVIATSAPSKSTDKAGK